MLLWNEKASIILLCTQRTSWTKRAQRQLSTSDRTAGQLPSFDKTGVSHGMWLTSVKKENNGQLFAVYLRNALLSQRNGAFSPALWPCCEPQQQQQMLCRDTTRLLPADHSPHTFPSFGTAVLWMPKGSPVGIRFLIHGSQHCLIPFLTSCYCLSKTFVAESSKNTLPVV